MGLGLQIPRIIGSNYKFEPAGEEKQVKIEALGTTAPISSILNGEEYLLGNSLCLLV